ncbi:MAG TPA: fatty acyl-AMP ligase [Candidatus Hydrogenedentes bacterium]|nr:fatty acyl-AMP ligase [Candidatus Hydrogenedentota bacterium]
MKILGEDKLAASLPVRDLVALVRERAENDCDKTYISFLEDGETVSKGLTAGALEIRARAIAAFLQERRLAGERAILIYPPGLDYVEAFYGCLFAGVWAVPAYPPNPMRLKQSLPRLTSIMRDALPAVILTTAAAAPLLEQLASHDPSFTGIPVYPTDSLPDDLCEGWRAAAVSPEDVAFIQYTSGSTSEPKGVMISHRNILHTVEDLARCVAYREWERLLIWLPTFHDMGLICGLVIPLYKGLPMYLMSPMAFLQRPLRWWQAVSNLGITQTVGPNFSYDLSVRKSTPENRAALRLEQLRIAGTVAEPIHRATIESFSEAFAPAGFRREVFQSGYGLAESTLKVSGGFIHWVNVRSAALKENRVEIVPENTEDTQSIISCGTTDMGGQVCIVDPETLCTCPPDRIGEIWVKGPAVAKGYWNRPEISECVFRAYTVDTGDGPFLRTGDLGFLHDQELYVTGRIKDLIILDGANIYPQDIEWTVQKSHEAVRPGCCAAFSIESDNREHVVVATELFPQVAPACALDQIAKEIRHQVSRYHQVGLHDVVFIKSGSIPKTSSGKIQRHATRRRYLENGLEAYHQ